MHSFFLLQLWNKNVKVKGNNYYPHLLLSYRNKKTNVKIKPTSVLRKNLGQLLFKFITFIDKKYFCTCILFTILKSKCTNENK